MAKVSIQDMAQAIAARHGLSPQDAEKFVAALFDVVNDGLHEEKIVKVKGLGTFKVIGVRERESVNVNTGERVVIESHGKITFTPDAVMRDLVNKPFAQFETVVLNEGVDLEEMGRVQSKDADDVEDVSVNDGDAVSEENALMPDESAAVEDVAEVLPDESDVVEDENKKEAQGSVEDTTQKETVSDVVPQPLVEFPAGGVTDEDTAEDTDAYGALEDDCGADDGGSFVSRHRGLLVTLLVVFVGAAAFVGGFYCGRCTVPPVAKTKTVPVAKKPLVSVAKGTDTLRGADTVSVVKVERLQADTLKKSAKADVRTDNNVPQATTASSLDLRNAAAMVNTGAYRIVGTDVIVTVKHGETLKGISKFYLGDGMECYIQVHNGVVDVKEGMKLKIPKLKLKKK